MACRYPVSVDNFIRWGKVQGDFSLNDLRSDGLPDLCNPDVPPVTPCGTSYLFTNIEIESEFSPPASGATRGFYISRNGEDMYIATNNTITRFNLLNTNVPSSAVSSGNSITLSGVSITGIHLTDDITKMYICDDADNTIKQYSISDRNPSTASFVAEIDVSGQSSNPNQVRFSADGLKMFVFDLFGIVYQYSLLSDGNVSGGSYDSVSFNFTGDDTTMLAFDWDNTGDLMVTAGGQNDRLYLYDASVSYRLTGFTQQATQSFPSAFNFNYYIQYFNSGSKLAAYNTNNEMIIYNLCV